MIRSLLKRGFHAFILLGLISIIAFGLSKLVPGDEVLDYLGVDDSSYSTSSSPLAQRNAYARVASKRGLDLPLFYFSIRPGYYPDSLYSIMPVEDRQALLKWVQVSKNKSASVQLYNDLISGMTYSCLRGDTSVPDKTICDEFHKLLRIPDLFNLRHSALQLQQIITQNASPDSSYVKIISTINQDIERLLNSPKTVAAIEWLPAVRWHGTHNQYHQWMAGFITFKPLTSLIDGRNAWSKILVSLNWTLLLNGFAFLLAMMLGLLIGVWSGTHDGYAAERLLNVVLFGLFALPSFWLATLFIYFFSTGEWLSIFPSSGLGPYHSADSFLERWGIIAVHLTLPVLCLALGALAYVSRQMKQSVVHQLSQPYVLSLRTQGISEKTILRKHVIRNALFPIVTLLGSSIPGLLSGSLIIEVIFSIPGMGRLMYTSLVARDWPVVFPILMFSATITVITYLLTDIVYKWIDPRVKSLDT